VNGTQSQSRAEDRTLLRPSGARHEPHRTRQALGGFEAAVTRLENGLIQLRPDHLKSFANALGYSPEQILLWGRYPGTFGDETNVERVRPSEQV
jgi:hypothetical protein